MSEPIIFNHTHLGCRYQIVIGKGYKLPMTSEDVTWYYLGDENGMATYELIKIGKNKMADYVKASDTGKSAHYGDSRGIDELTVETVRESSLEEELDTMNKHVEELGRVMAHIQETKMRIQEKTMYANDRGAKLQEVVLDIMSKYDERSKF